MPFEPPRCPNTACRHHHAPEPSFFVRRGVYHPKCRQQPVPRFRCRRCRIGFSRQTFRHDYRDRRPECNRLLFELLTSGVGLRQAGRLLHLDVHAVQKKMCKLAATAWLLHGNLAPSLPPGRTYLMDEEETFESASIRPLTMPVVIERETWFVVATAVGPIRRLAKPGTVRRRMQDAAERRDGRRPDRSRHCVRQVLADLERRTRSAPIVLQTDEKASYRTIAKSVFGARAAHETTPGKLVRNTANLFPINTTLAMTRDNCGRLRRKSWLVSKKGERLQAHLGLFVVYRNYVRQRFNRDPELSTAATVLGLLPRPLRPAEVVAWRQDWGARSVHPMVA